ncbi:MAG: hypothetical protein K1X72_02600 [Pyrinomonadaceae bacterium]|nr:hypothetical protein [Pyrinomonadaceae bacterium]
MKYNSIEAFVPSGKDFQLSKQLFLELGFKIVWEAEDYIGFENNGCRFILQNYNVKEFAENFMMSVKVENLDEFWKTLNKLDLPEKFGVKLREPTSFPWGKEVNLIDIAGVCWHFSESK